MLPRLLLPFAILAGIAAAETLAGKVVEDHSNNPLPSVELRVHRIGVRQLAAELETDAAGRFSGDGLPAGEYRIELAKANYIGATIRLSGPSSNLTIRMVRCGVISGSVLDGNGRPLRGATVYVMPKPAGGGPLRPFTTAGRNTFISVNERGQYRIHNLAPGEYGVAVSYGASVAIYGSTGGGAAIPGIGSGVQFYPDNAQPRMFTVAGGEEYRNIDFTLLPSTRYSISGKLDLPAPKTRFWLALSTAEQPALAAAVTDTKEDGTFRFEGIAPGSYNLTAAGPTRGYGGRATLDSQPLFGHTRVSVGGTNVEGVSFALAKGRSLSFILRSAGSTPEGACPATAQISLAPLEDWAAFLDRTAEVNFQKAQTIDDIAPARFQVNVTQIGESCYQPAPAILDMTAGAPESPVAVLVAPAGSIRGKLVGAARPTDYAVALLPADPLAGAQDVRVAFPDEAGKFSFGSLPPGPYRIAAQRAADARARWVNDRTRMIEIQIAGGAPTEMELPAPPERKE